MLQIYFSRQCDKFSFRVCVQILFSRLCVRFSFLVCVTNLVFSSVWQMLYFRLCAEVLSGSVWPIYFSFSRVLWSVLSLKIWFTWQVTSRDESVWQMLWTRHCAGFVLSGSVWPIYFPFWRVLCLHVWRFFVLCDLRLWTNVMNALLVITLECLVLGRVVNKWSVSLVPLVILP